MTCFGCIPDMRYEGSLINFWTMTALGKIAGRNSRIQCEEERGKQFDNHSLEGLDDYLTYFVRLIEAKE